MSGPAPSTSPAAARSAPGPGSAASSGSFQGFGGNVTKFCDAFTVVKTAKGGADPAATGAAFLSAAADMRRYAPASVKAATETYAVLIENTGKAAQAGTLDAMTLQQALTRGMAEKPEDIATVAIWVSKNCPR